MSTAGDQRRTRPRVKRPDLRREELLRAAEQLLLERGPADVTIADITAAADAAKGTFYRYFATKEELFIVLRQYFVESLVSTVLTATARVPASDWQQKVRVLVHAGIDHQIANRSLHDLLFHQFRAADVLTRAVQSDEHIHLASTLLDFIGGGVAAGAFQVADPQSTSIVLYHALHGAADEAASYEDRTKQLGIIDAAAEMTIRSLTP